MRLSKWSLILACLTFTVFAQNQKVVQPNKDNVGIYQNEIREAYEKPIENLGRDDRLIILQSKRNHHRVRTPSGTEGWIEKNLVSSSTKSRGFVFESAEVIGYLDNPTPVFIIDMDDPNADPITLDRSFKDALKENVDKETMERLAR